MKFFQLNMNRSRHAHDLLWARAKEERVDFMLLSEPNLASVVDCDGLVNPERTSAIFSVSRKYPLIRISEGPNFVCGAVNEIDVYSCYFSPNIAVGEFEEGMDALLASFHRRNKRAIVVGDFNSKSAEWDACHTEEGVKFFQKL